MEFSGAEKQPLHHPALAGLAEFEAAYSRVSSRTPPVGSAELRDLEAQRDQPGGFTDFAATQDLAGISTLGDLKQRAAQIAAELEQMAPEERFDALLAWRDKAHAGSSLVSIARMSANLADALGGLQGKTVNDLTEEELDVLHWETRNPARNNEFLLYPYTDLGVLEQADDTPVAALRVAEDAPDYMKAAANFACHADVVKTHLLYKAVALQTAELVGTDIVKGIPVVFNTRVRTFEQAQAYSRPLPDGLARWRRLDLLDEKSVPEFSPNGFDGMYGELERVDDMLVSGEHRMSAAHPYIAAHQELYAFLRSGPAHITQRGSEDRQKADRLNHRHLLREVDRTRRNFMGHMLSEVLGVFGEVHESLHPDIEQRARRLAGYVLSDKHHDVHRKLNETASQPLATAVPALFEIAYRQGLAPLVIETNS